MNQHRAEPAAELPEWARDVLACPSCKSKLALRADRFYCSRCGHVGRWESGVARFGASSRDDTIALYQSTGGPTLYDRMQIPFTTSELDGAVYHAYLKQLRPARRNAVIIDVGAGDGRNTHLWLDSGQRRVVAVDAIAAPLLRIRRRVAAQQPRQLARLLTVQADMRALPLADNQADLVQAVEALYFLNEDYEQGVAECARLLRRGGRFMLAEPSDEGAYVTTLFSNGIASMLRVATQRRLHLIHEKFSIFSRIFTAEELATIVARTGLTVVEQKGLSIMAALLGHLRATGQLRSDDQRRHARVVKLLTRLGETGQHRRFHVIVARKPFARHKKRQAPP